MVTLVQEVETRAERLALKIAELIDKAKHDEAHKAIFEATAEYRLTHSQVLAVAYIARQMLFGERWKQTC